MRFAMPLLLGALGVAGCAGSPPPAAAPEPSGQQSLEKTAGDAVAAGTRTVHAMRGCRDAVAAAQAPSWPACDRATAQQREFRALEKQFRSEFNALAPRDSGNSPFLRDTEHHLQAIDRQLDDLTAQVCDIQRNRDVDVSGTCD